MCGMYERRTSFDNMFVAIRIKRILYVLGRIGIDYVKICGKKTGSAVPLSYKSL